MSEPSGTLSDALFRKLEQRIVSGEMPPGSQFPTQREICETEKVSRTVVREAVARLASQGMTTSRQGSGVYVAETARYRAFQVTRDELNELADVIKLLEMRLAIEAEMAALAAARRTLADIGAMRGALRRMDEAGPDAAAAALADGEFHASIAAATKNDYFVRLVDFFGVRLVPPRSLYLREEPVSAHVAYASKVKAEHDAILDAIVRMDAPRARDAARHHMQESLSRHTQLGKVIGVLEGREAG